MHRSFWLGNLTHQLSWGHSPQSGTICSSQYLQTFWPPLPLMMAQDLLVAKAVENHEQIVAEAVFGEGANTSLMGTHASAKEKRKWGDGFEKQTKWAQKNKPNVDASTLQTFAFKFDPLSSIYASHQPENIAEGPSGGQTSWMWVSENIEDEVDWGCTCTEFTTTSLINCNGPLKLLVVFLPRCDLQ